MVKIKAEWVNHDWLLYCPLINNEKYVRHCLHGCDEFAGLFDEPFMECYYVEDDDTMCTWCTKEIKWNAPYKEEKDGDDFSHFFHEHCYKNYREWFCSIPWDKKWREANPDSKYNPDSDNYEFAEDERVPL